MPRRVKGCGLDRASDTPAGPRAITRASCRVECEHLHDDPVAGSPGSCATGSDLWTLRRPACMDLLRGPGSALRISVDRSTVDWGHPLGGLRRPTANVVQLK
jgi:hypothetical protein